MLFTKTTTAEIKGGEEMGGKGKTPKWREASIQKLEMGKGSPDMGSQDGNGLPGVANRNPLGQN